ncbi:MAG: peptidylprolyl isomerase [Burkholderiaceae bacterium]
MNQALRHSHPHRAVSAACAALLAVVAFGAQAQQQGQRPASTPSRGLGITDLMRNPSTLSAPSRAVRPVLPSLGGVPTQRSAEYIVALVNSEPITNSDVLVRMERVLQNGNSEASRVPRPELAKLVLERLIGERAQLQLAKETGVRIDDVAVDQAEQTVARQNQLTVAEMRQRIEADGISRAEFRADLRRELVLSRLREREVEPKVKISDLEIDDYIREQRANPLSNATEVNMAHVLVAVPERATEAQVASFQQKAQGIAQRARGGEDFAKLAREMSDAQDKANGGALGLRSAERYPPLFLEATQNTPVGGVAGPVRSGAGFHVLKVLAKTAPAVTEATVSQSQVRHILLRVDAQRTADQAVAQLKEFKRRVEAGTDFAGLARDNSQDGSAKDGGDLGWRRTSEFVPEFEEAVNRLQPGQMSDPVVSRFGVHLIKLEGRRDAKLNQAEQRDAARSALREKRLDEAFESWSQEVRARAYVEYREPPQS